MNHKVIVGQIDPIWNIEEVEKLDYFYEPFNDSDVVDVWRTLYNKEFTTGMQADYRSQQPACQEAVFQSICKQGHILANQGFSWYRMMPGDMIPEHSDTYANYCKYYNISKEQAIRILVLLQDWQPGFLLEVAGQSFSHYLAGTFVIWSADCPHTAGNWGQIPRYTLQITATAQ